MTSTAAIIGFVLGLAAAFAAGLGLAWWAKQENDGDWP